VKPLFRLDKRLLIFVMDEKRGINHIQRNRKKNQWTLRRFGRACDLPTTFTRKKGSSLEIKATGASGGGVRCRSYSTGAEAGK